MSLAKNDRIYFRKKVMEIIDLPEIRIIDQFVQHGNVTCLDHCIAVSYLSFCLCKKLRIKVDFESLIRGALLHDYFLYDWHIKDKNRPLHAFYHPKCAYKNARKVFDLTEIEKDIILKHMWPLTLSVPSYKEAFIVCIADKICSVVETFHGHYLLPRFARER
ncbi:HD domain-containing protein [Anaeromicropila herbilytica]|uniref:Phosphohydrolase n=1 Tax=Anaeromicropila herbilytica TaxID=2785025 RepID=A0A7R7EKB5_9FIRM|nr:HD domain-containing protein [Anaeromicropila herbilytica]BCN30299.1 phosphohydrolase [Anaeromicropila herbilytica]